MQETRRDQPSRKVWKLRLIRELHQSGYNRTDILNLFNFIDWVLGLPQALEIEFWRDLKAYEEERKVPYITSVERIGYNRGKEEGREEGREEGAQLQARSLLLGLLTRKFGAMPDRALKQLHTLSVDQLERLGEVLLDLASLDDLTDWLNRQA
jgi:predicted transposase YdaD